MMVENGNGRTDQERAENKALEDLKNDFELLCSSKKNICNKALVKEFFTKMRNDYLDEDKPEYNDFIWDIKKVLTDKIDEMIFNNIDNIKNWKSQSFWIKEMRYTFMKTAFWVIMKYWSTDLAQALWFDYYEKNFTYQSAEKLITLLSSDPEDMNEWTQEDEERAENYELEKKSENDELESIKNDFELLCSSEKNLRNKDLVTQFSSNIRGHLSDERKFVFDSPEDFVDDFVTRLYEQINFQRGRWTDFWVSWGFSNSEEAIIFKNLLYREIDKSLRQALWIDELFTRQTK